MKLMMSKYDVRLANEDMCNEFYVHFEGPKDSHYSGGHWNVHVSLPQEYPYKSPCIGFCNTIFHPNVDEASGSVCLDVINQTWSPMFELVNVFDLFLPQLLMYPNPTDPLNQEAAALHMADEKAYAERVREYVLEYATLESADTRARGGSSSKEDSHMSVTSTPDHKASGTHEESDDEDEDLEQEEFSDIDDSDDDL